MSRLVDISGQKYGRLTAMKRAENKKGSKAKWLCRCDCGNETIADSGNLRNGHTKSCGCFNKEVVTERFTTHGLRQTRLYKIWSCIKQRCGNPKNCDFPDYGGRGITICNEWQKDFQAFNDWALANGYTDELTIDRKNVDGNYEPSNCRWANTLGQAQNQRMKSTNTSGYIGVDWSKTSNKWKAHITVNRQNIYLGLFEDKLEAAKIYNAAAIKYHGVFAKQNKV